jgi:hypothetical protein
MSCQHEQDSARLSGSYGGTLQGSQGVAAVSVRLDDAQGALSGTAQATGLTFVSGRTYYAVGAHTGAEVDLTIRAGWETETQAFGFIEGECIYVLSGQASSSRLQGSYSTLGTCPQPDQGTFDLRRQ